MDVDNAKQALREKIWRLMTERKIAVFPLPCWGRIPNFVGAEKAAEKLRTIKEWRKARVIFANPDAAQRKVRENALKDGKTLIMASPRLKSGYLLITPEKIRGKEAYASTIKGAFKFGVRVEEFPKPDLVITGCVAVDAYGNRLGKGGGYGDAEILMIKDRFGEVPIATTVHPVQIVERVPVKPKDQKIDIVATPKEVIYISKAKRHETRKTCKWYAVCPMKRFYEEGKLDRKWIENYCMGNYESCVRYRLEEKGILHPDNMLPNGEIDESLK
ncbi:5-formyltetrahydrofolate cyclo-ligase [Candidatus Bathyarchaeota archaeon]|nr:MAG: 5-formyltetrahydrofolate cyclo-ligase [Candidatus Bathyarchaeota archaeon]